MRTYRTALLAAAAAVLATGSVMPSLADNYYFRVKPLVAPPLAFSFAPASEANPGVRLASSPTRVRNHANRTASVTGGEYQVCSAADCSDQGDNWRTAPTPSVPSDFYARVRLTTAAFGGTAVARLAVGSAAADFAVSTRQKDEAPDAFSFAAASGTVGVRSTSARARVGGHDGVRLAVSGQGSPEFRVCADAGCSTVLRDWSAASYDATTEVHADLRMTPSEEGANSATLTAGTGSAVWTVSATRPVVGMASSSPGASCLAVRNANPSLPSGAYWLGSSPAVAYQAYCDMVTDGGGWTLAAKFSNADGANWITGNAWWYSLTTPTGNTTDPSQNGDAISRAFWDAQAAEVRLTRTDAPTTSLFRSTSNCLGGNSFRGMFSSLGTYSSTFPSGSVRKTCSGVLGGSYTSTDGFGYATCSGNTGSPNSISFISQWSQGDGSAIMIGGGGDSCSRADHGIAVTEANNGGFDYFGGSSNDFGNDGNGQGAKGYGLAMWVR